MGTDDSQRGHEQRHEAVQSDGISTDYALQVVSEREAGNGTGQVTGNHIIK